MYDVYQEMILQHYRSPRNFGPLDPADLHGEESNPLCGDHIEMRIRLDGAKGTVEEIKFTGDGCAISVASASLLTQKVKGRPLAEVSALTRDDVIKLVGIPLSPVRIKCALTGFSALGRALHPSESEPVGETGSVSP
ncbi:MAG: iron-sulfur cluster assembly scaffold protein [Thermoplasmata archaeon]|nr:iron-sulfur cluster assembly scaffold protein [Thermoplasmata archaeon]